MLLQATGISKSFGSAQILSNITLQIREKERIGMVGANGAGKSTLLKILAGELACDAGEIHKAKQLRIGYLAQNTGTVSQGTLWEELAGVFSDLREMERELRDLENKIADPALFADAASHETAMRKYAELAETFRESGGYAVDAKIRGVLHGMGFAETDPDTAVKNLSGGQKTRLALAKLLLQEPDLLILDEPTNHLDIPALTWLEHYLRAYRGAMLIVSHDRYFLDAVVETIIEIERASAKQYSGNYSKYIALKAADYEAEMKRYEKQQDEIARMEDFIRRNIVRASTTRRAQSRRKMLERMDVLERPKGDLKKARFAFDFDRATGKNVLEVSNLAGGYDRGTIFRGIDLHLQRGETVALIGPNGVGKSTLLKILAGKITPLTGNVVWGANVRLGYYDQELEQLTPANTVLEEVWNDFPRLEEVKIRTVLGGFLFSGDDVKKRIADLSGGEKARVSLAKLMLKRANVLILDEPTNHLDLFSKEVLESALLEFTGTLLFVSHDRYFLNKMAERIIELSPDGAQHFLGNYDDYVDKKKELAAVAVAGTGAVAGTVAGAFAGSSAVAGTVAGTDAGKHPGDKTQHGAAGPVKTDYDAEKRSKQEERGRMRKIEALEQEISALEQQINQLQNELALPEVYQDYIAVQQKQAEIAEKNAALERCYAEWEKLQERM
ncbi:MAG TPA: ABC-F family ATP-binding cassette domain-containing protein [Bacilli bacterium]